MAYRSLDEYLALPYTVEMTRDEGEGGSGWFARVLELPGCMTQADSMSELETMIQDAMRGWIETAIEDGQPVPEPRREADFSGKFIVRLPRSLHRTLVEAAERDGVSLNTLINSLLSQAVGARFAISEPQARYRSDKRDVQ